MSQAEVNCAKSLLAEHFGSIVAKVGAVLLTNGPSSIKLIRLLNQESIINIKASLRVLLQHQLCQFNLNARNQIDYEINIQRVLCLERYGRFAEIAHTLDAQFGSMLIEQLLLCGQSSLKDLLQSVIDKTLIENPSISSTDAYSLPRQAFETFKKMLRDTYIEPIRLSSEDSYQGIHIPKIDLQSEIDCRPLNERNQPNELNEPEEPPIKRIKIEPKESSDSNTPAPWFRVNVHRFDRCIREQLTIQAVRNYYEDEKAGKLAEIIFKLNQNPSNSIARTSLVSAFEIINEALHSKVFENEFQVRNYLKLFASDNKFISCCEHTGDGGKFVVDVEYSLDELVKDHIAATIGDSFGPKSARMFRLLTIKKFLQQKQLGEDAMLSGKESKERSYTLYREGYLKLLQYCKTPDYAPLKTCFVFSVDLKEIVAMIMGKAFHALEAMHCRREHELQQNSVLLEKKKLIDAIISSLANQEGVEEQIEELNQSFTSHEKEQIKKIDQIVLRTHMAECQIDETLLLLQSWLSAKNAVDLNAINEKSR